MGAEYPWDQISALEHQIQWNKPLLQSLGDDFNFIKRIPNSSQETQYWNEEYNVQYLDLQEAWFHPPSRSFPPEATLHSVP